MILALAGGVGGARMARGLIGALSPGQLTTAVNVGDDFEHLGLAISPDLDTVMYTLAGLHNPVTGWGRLDETWNFMETMATIGGETWFRLGDRDLAVHIERSNRLRSGESLSAITADLCARFDIRHAVVPVTDHPVATIVETDAGELAFQEYFVRRRCEPVVRGFRFAGAASAKVAPPLASLLESRTIEGIVICPSNPWLSIAPMLAIDTLRSFLKAKTVPVVAISPIVAGAAVKGPAGKIMHELGVETSAMGVVRHYGDLVDGWILDERDSDLRTSIESTGCQVTLADTIMSSAEKSTHLAQVAIQLLRSKALAR